MTLAGRSRLQIELVIVENMRIAESSKEPSTQYLSMQSDETSQHKAAHLLCIARFEVPVFECLDVADVES
jgi:hypothetical protein